MFKVFYYYYFLFYAKVLKDDSPHFLATLALGASISFILNEIIYVLIAVFYDMLYSHKVAFAIVLGTTGVLALYIRKNGVAQRVVEEKPKFFNSHRWSIMLTLLFFLVTLSFMFIGPIWVKSVLVE